MKYSPQIVLAYFREMGIPTPELEYVFSPPRRWRWDFAWPTIMDELGPPVVMGGVAMEVQGGIFIQGRHSRGAALIKEWEKLNRAAVLGWRVLYCQPKDLCTLDMVNTIKEALGLKSWD